MGGFIIIDPVPILLEASLEIYSVNQFQDSCPRKFSASKIKRFTVVNMIRQYVIRATSTDPCYFAILLFCHSAILLL